jgi:hypothetical protein
MLRLTQFGMAAATALTLGAFGIAGQLAAQETTEQFIPIGESPGVSGEDSVVGEIVAVDNQKQEVLVSSGERRLTFKVEPDTRIYMDRSDQRLENTETDFAECRVGRRVEIKPHEDDAAIASWIKIQGN